MLAHNPYFPNLLDVFNETVNDESLFTDVHYIIFVSIVTLMACIIFSITGKLFSSRKKTNIAISIFFKLYIFAFYFPENIVALFQIVFLILLGVVLILEFFYLSITNRYFKYFVFFLVFYSSLLLTVRNLYNATEIEDHALTIEYHIKYVK